MSSMYGKIFTFIADSFPIADDFFRTLAKLFDSVPDLIGMDASTFWMIVLGIAAVWGVYWVAQQFLD